MTEAQMTQQFIVRLKASLGPSFTIIKHNDRISKGVPDVSVSNGKGRTLWIEFKKNKKSPRPAHQRLMLERLGGVYVLLEDQLLVSGDNTWPPYTWIYDYFVPR